MFDRRQFYGPNGETYNPTLKSPSKFNVEEDVTKLREAMKGIGTNEDTFIEILANRNYAQRMKIRDTYKSTFGKDLIEKVSSELSGNFKRLVKMLLTEWAKISARALYKAMHGAGTKESVIIEILCTSTNDELEIIKSAYTEVLKEEGHNNSSRTLETDLKNDLSGCLEHLAVALIQCHRDELTIEKVEKIAKNGLKSVLNMELVEKDVDDLYDAGEGRLGTDEATFIRIFASRNIWHIKAIADLYEQKTEKPLLQAIDDETSGDFGKALMLTVKTCIERVKAYAEMLKDAMAGLGTNDSTLMRIIATRCEIDLQDIAKQFELDEGKSLEDYIRSETSGDYRKLLLALLGADWKA